MSHPHTQKGGRTETTTAVLCTSCIGNTFPRPYSLPAKRMRKGVTKCTQRTHRDALTVSAIALPHSHPLPPTYGVQHKDSSVFGGIHFIQRGPIDVQFLLHVTRHLHHLPSL